MGKDTWSPTKGHLDAGETAFEAAKRETREESGLEENMLTIFENITTKIKYYTFEKFPRPKMITYWAAKIKDPNQEIVLSDEHLSFKWLGLSEAKAISSRDAPMFEKFNEAILKQERAV